MASHGRIPGLVTQDRPRRQGAVPRSPARQAVPRPPRRPVHPHGYGVDAGVSDTARRKPARSSRSRHRFLLRHSLCPATRPLAVSALPASVLTDRAMTCPAANRPQPKPEPVMAVPFPVMSLPSHSASRAPRSQTRPAAQPVYLCIAAVCGNAAKGVLSGLRRAGARRPWCRPGEWGPYRLREGQHERLASLPGARAGGWQAAAAGATGLAAVSCGSAAPSAVGRRVCVRRRRTGSSGGRRAGSRGQAASGPSRRLPGR